MKYVIEIATTDFETTRAAVEGGADRIELCSALSEGGITPSFGLLKKCREAFDLPIFPILRPRSGDFLYSSATFDIMREDVQLFKALGFDGVVLGLLNSDGSIDVSRCSRLVEAAFPMEVTFHRAFDRCKNPQEALEQIISMGCQRVLTSGQQPTAVQGSSLISELIQQAGNRITIMPGSGVRKENIAALAQNTGATEFHTSLRSYAASNMKFVHPSFANSAESYSNPIINVADVAALREQLVNSRQRL